MTNKIKFIIRLSCLFVLTSVNAQTCDFSVVPPTVINGVSITSTFTGDVGTYPTAYTSCSTTTPANSIWLGAAGSFSYTLNFSEPVNNLLIALTATGQTDNENFIFSTNAGNPSIALLTNCFSTINGNEIITGLGAGADGGGGEFVISTNTNFSSLTITGNGGIGGSLLSICSNSIAPICNVSNLTPTIPSNSVLVCSGESFNLSELQISSPPTNAIISWHNNSLISTTSILTNLNVGPGTYYVTFFDTINFCFSNATQFTVNQSSPTLSAGEDQVICRGDSVILNASGSTNFSWNNNVVNNQVFFPLNTTTYTVTGVDLNGCQSSDDVTIIVNEVPTIFAGDDIVICEGESVLLNATGAPILEWSSQTIQNNIPFYPSTSGLYTVIGTDENNCSNTDELLIIVNQTPVSKFIVNISELNLQENHIETTNQSVNATNFYWTFGDNSEIDLNLNPSHTYTNLNQENYTITLIAENESFCRDTSFLIIQVRNEPICYIPTSFTPNGDEINNVFLPLFSSINNVKNYRLSIYNRWGELLFESLDPLIGWDGSYLSSSVEDNTYVWKVEYLYTEKVSLVGHVTLIK